MTEWNEQQSFNQQLVARVKALREDRHVRNKSWTAEKVARTLGVSLDNYRKYETRSPLPHYLLPKAAEIYHVSIAFLLVGRDEAPTQEIKVVATKNHRRNKTG